MSLLILAGLIGVGLIIISVLRAYEHEYVGLLFTGYLTTLIFTTLGCLGIGVYFWLKNDRWLTISPYLLLSNLEHENPVRKLLLAETSWLGLQRVSIWYLDQNIGWSFMLTMIVLFTVLVFTSD